MQRIFPILIGLAFALGVCGLKCNLAVTSSNDNSFLKPKQCDPGVKYCLTITRISVDKSLGGMNGLKFLNCDTDRCKKVGTSKAAGRNWTCCDTDLCNTLSN